MGRHPLPGSTVQEPSRPALSAGELTSSSGVPWWHLGMECCVIVGGGDEVALCLEYGRTSGRRGFGLVLSVGPLVDSWGPGEAVPRLRLYLARVGRSAPRGSSYEGRQERPGRQYGLMVGPPASPDLPQGGSVHSAPRDRMG